MTLAELIALIASLKGEENKATITQLNKGIGDFKKSYDADMKTKDDTFTDLASMKEMIKGLKTAFAIGDDVSYKDTVSKIDEAKKALDIKISTLGTNEEGQASLLATMKIEFDEMKTDYKGLKTTLSEKEVKLEKSEKESILKGAFGKVGEMEYFDNVKGDISKIITDNPDKKVEDICAEYVKGKPVFAKKETSKGPGGIPPNGNTETNEPLSMTELMAEVSARTNGEN